MALPPSSYLFVVFIVSRHQVGATELVAGFEPDGGAAEFYLNTREIGSGGSYLWGLGELVCS